MKRAIIRTLWIAIAVVVAAPSAAAAQDSFARAKSLYASADYEEALQLLANVKSTVASTEVEAYRVFCLVALGRRDEARDAIQNIVRTDPLYRPSELDASPRIRSFFDDVRKPLLPEMVRQSYGTAKTAYDRKEFRQAQAGFGRVIALVDEIGGTDQGVADMRTLASGFRDLSTAALQPPPPPPAPAPTPTPPPAAPPPQPFFTDADAGVVRPVAISKPTPDWFPNAVESRMNYEGVIELLLDERGKVLGVTLVKSVNPRYDPKLIEAAKSWTFTPAMKNGVAVKYKMPVAVRLAAR